MQRWPRVRVDKVFLSQLNFSRTVLTRTEPVCRTGWSPCNIYFVSVLALVLYLCLLRANANLNFTLRQKIGTRLIAEAGLHFTLYVHRRRPPTHTKSY